MAFLGFFSKDAGDHPLADPKETKEALAALVGADAHTYVDEVCAWLQSLGTAETLRLERRAELALQLDEASASHARRLAREYLTSAHSRSREFRLWQSGTRYWAALIAAYEEVLTRADAAKNSLKPFQPLLHARMLHAYGAALKWGQFRYGPIDPNIWSDAGRLYLAAGKLASQPLTLYEGWPATSVAGEYLKLLVFHASSMSNLLPLEIELAERLIAHFLPMFVLTHEARPENVYWVDACKPLPPSRLLKQPQPSPTLRYFSTGAAQSSIEVLRGRIHQTREIPSNLPLGGQYPPEVVVKVLDHLAQSCAPNPPERSHDRQRIKSLLAVIHGFAEIRLRLGGDDGTQEGETWVAEDVSIGGFGAQVSLVNNEWLKVGVFVGMRPEGSEHWLVGIVRRFSRETQGVGSVGVETLGRAPRAATLECTGARHPCVLLDAGLGIGEETLVLLPSAAWEDYMPAVVSCEGLQAKLTPRLVVLHADDYTVGRYRVEEIG